LGVLFDEQFSGDWTAESQTHPNRTGLTRKMTCRKGLFRRKKQESNLDELLIN